MRDSLIASAERAQELAHAPYSELKVGAALLAADGEIVTGVNVENRSYGVTICAERVAVFRAVSEGRRQFGALALVAEPDSFRPCGACLQVLSEFSERGDLEIVFKLGGRVVTRSLRELLPAPYLTPQLDSAKAAVANSASAAMRAEDQGCR